MTRPCRFRKTGEVFNLVDRCAACAYNRANLAAEDKRWSKVLVVTHEMGFARHAADEVMFMDHGSIVESNAPDRFFTASKEERSRMFLSQILH